MAVSRNQILQLLRHAGLRTIFASHGGARFGLAELNGVDDDDDDYDDDDDGGHGGMVGRRRRKRKTSKVDYPKVPSKVGQELMDSGNFGSNEYYRDILIRKKQKLAMRIMSRELGRDAVQDRRGNKLLSQVNTNTTLLQLVSKYFP